MLRSFILVDQKGDVKLIKNFWGPAEGKHPSPWMPCPLAELSKQTRQQRVLVIHQDSRIKPSRRMLANNGSILMHRGVGGFHQGQGCSSRTTTCRHLQGVNHTWRTAMTAFPIPTSSHVFLPYDTAYPRHFFVGMQSHSSRLQDVRFHI